MDKDRKQQLLMGLMDGELNSEERAEVQEYLRRDQRLRHEYDQLCRASDALRLLGEPALDEQRLRALWRSPFEMGVRRASYLMIGAGFLSLLGFATWEYVVHGHKALLPGVAGSGMAVGVILLFLQVLRDRWMIWKHDPYREIEK
jgi:anti-sigma factor RsiW